MGTIQVAALTCALSLSLPLCDDLDSNLITGLFSLFSRRYPLEPKALVSTAVRGRYSQGPGTPWLPSSINRIRESKLENWGITNSSQSLRSPIPLVTGSYQISLKCDLFLHPYYPWFSLNPFSLSWMNALACWLPLVTSPSRPLSHITIHSFIHSSAILWELTRLCAKHIQ